MRQGVRRPTRLAPFALASALLAACGQQPSPASLQAAAHPTPTGDTYAARSAYLTQTSQGEAGQAEAVQQGKVTDLSQTMPAQNRLSAQATDKSVPIILVHGLSGFGRSDFGGLLKYWGGTLDVQEDLRSLGYQVFTAKVGPFSSNWDRAAELYAQIKGGCVDYGAARAASFGHERFDPAKCYPGFYPQWDAAHPVNLVGHSMGGPTAAAPPPITFRCCCPRFSRW